MHFAEWRGHVGELAACNAPTVADGSTLQAILRVFHQAASFQFHCFTVFPGPGTNL
jgi:hypothetical protein